MSRRTVQRSALNLTNGEEAMADVPAGGYEVDIVPAAGGKAVWSDNVDLAEGVNTIAYAWGSLEDGTFDVAVQTIDGLHSAPGAVTQVRLALRTNRAQAHGW